jgi:site-specific recombinase XerD
MNKTFKILLFLRKPKNYKEGKMPIYLRLTIDGESFEMNISRECEPHKWNSNAGCMKGTSESVRQFNNYLESYKSKIYEAQRELLNAGENISIQSMKNKLRGVEAEEKMLVNVYQHHIHQISELVGKEYAVGTLKRFKAALSSLTAFLKSKYQTEDFPISDLSHEFITEYEFYLKSVRNVEHNTAMGIIKKLKKIVRLCVANNWLEKDPFMNYKVKIKDTNRAYLLEDELKRLVSKQIEIDRLGLVRDVFVFSCYTGLAYSDIEKLTTADIAIGIDGEKWIFTNRKKTETASRIPLLPVALRIIEKYASDPRVENSGKLLPMMTNQRMNGYLKELSDMCDIKKELTFHCARHTFATTVTLTNGVPIETVSKMLGHKSIRTTQQYAKIIDRKVSDDMRVLRNKLEC